MKNLSLKTLTTLKFVVLILVLSVFMQGCTSSGSPSSSSSPDPVGFKRLGLADLASARQFGELFFSADDKTLDKDYYIDYILQDGDYDRVSVSKKEESDPAGSFTLNFFKTGESASSASVIIKPDIEEFVYCQHCPLKDLAATTETAVSKFKEEFTSFEMNEKQGRGFIFPYGIGMTAGTSDSEHPQKIGPVGAAFVFGFPSALSTYKKGSTTETYKVFKLVSAIGYHSYTTTTSNYFVEYGPENYTSRITFKDPTKNYLKFAIAYKEILAEDSVSSDSQTADIALVKYEVPESLTLTAFKLDTEDLFSIITDASKSITIIDNIPSPSASFNPRFEHTIRSYSLGQSSFVMTLKGRFFGFGRKAANRDSYIAGTFNTKIKLGGGQAKNPRKVPLGCLSS